MLLCGESSIRDVIAFPKTQKASCLMTGAPSDAGKEQLEELNLRLRLGMES
jgi:aspartyl-tRNA synthetase